jgi:uncharacterized protein (DUF2252 family)
LSLSAAVLGAWGLTMGQGRSAKDGKAPRPSERGPILTRSRHLKMARSAHAYVRGGTVKFYEWLEASAGKLPSGPPIWICGDCHIGNMGPLADAKGRVDIQIRDLDQTVIGNPAHDLIRLGLSLASAARGSDLPGVITARMLEGLIEGYEAALAEDFEAKSRHPPMIGAVLGEAARRTWKHLAAERLNGSKPEIPIGKKFWPVSRTERRELEALCLSQPILDLVRGLKSRDNNAEIRLLDAAYWMKGCSSLGRLRYAVLLGSMAATARRTSASWISRKRSKPPRRAIPRRKCPATTPSALSPGLWRCRLTLDSAWRPAGCWASQWSCAS